MKIDIMFLVVYNFLPQNYSEKQIFRGNRAVF